MTSKKDYLRAAQIIREHPTFLGMPGSLDERQDMIIIDAVSIALEEAFIEFFRNDNPKFDESKFRSACQKKRIRA